MRAEWESGTGGERITITWVPTHKVDSVEALEAASDQLWERLSDEMQDLKAAVRLQVVITASESGTLVDTKQEQTFSKTYRRSEEEWTLPPAAKEEKDDRLPLHRDIEMLCEIAGRYREDFLKSATARQAMMEEIEDRCRSKEFRTTFKAVGLAQPEDRHRLLQEALSEVGVKNWSCPALQHLYEAVARGQAASRE